MAPPAPQIWAPAHHFFRVHDPASFAWLDGLSPLSTTAIPPSAKCFGIDVVYLALDLLHWFPSETVLAIPFLEVPPPEYFLVCNSGGQRWWCFVLLRQRADKACALVFDVDPSVLLIAGLGLRETDIDHDGAVSRGRDFNLAPNAAVLCPKDNRAIRFERLSPQTQEYFCVYEGGEPGGGVNAYSTSRAHKYTAGFEIPQLVPICEAMSHEIKGNFISPEWPSYDGESIFMQDPSFQTPCWRYWVNRQKTSGVKDISWDELHELWTDAFGAVETRAPSNTSVAEIERILHKPARRPTHGRVHRKGSARLSAPTTPFEDRFYSAAKPS